MAFKFFILALPISTIIFSLVSGQTLPPNPPGQTLPPNPPTPPCTPSMITTFTPCINFTTNNGVNGTSPSSDCCNSLKSLMSNGRNCLCLIATGSIPFQIPINQTLAISLPRACNMPGVPLQCKATTDAPSPAPTLAPGPVTNVPSISPSTAPSPTPSTGLAPPEPLSPKSSPGAGSTPTTPSTPTAQSTPTPTPPTPTTNGASPASNRAGVTPSAAQPAYGISPLVLAAMLGSVALRLY